MWGWRPCKIPISYISKIWREIEKIPLTTHSMIFIWFFTMFWIRRECLMIMIMLDTCLNDNHSLLATRFFFYPETLFQDYMQKPIWLNIHFLKTWRIWNPFYPKMLYGKFGWNWLLWRSSRKCVSLQTHRQTENRWSEKLIWV